MPRITKITSRNSRINKKTDMTDIKLQILKNYDVLYELKTILSFRGLKSYYDKPSMPEVNEERIHMGDEFVAKYNTLDEVEKRLFNTVSNKLLLDYKATLAVMLYEIIKSRGV